MTVKELYNSTQALKPVDKARLAELILQDLDRPDPLIEKEWIKEVKRRREMIKSGKEKMLTYDQVMARYK
jgi:putative addiction module component (TIGR02574 family)